MGDCRAHGSGAGSGSAFWGAEGVKSLRARVRGLPGENLTQLLAHLLNLK